MASFDYLPNQIYVPIGIIDQVDDLAPSIHCHADAKLSWLHLDDSLPSESGSARDVLNSSDGIQ